MRSEEEGTEDRGHSLHCFPRAASVPGCSACLAYEEKGRGDPNSLLSSATSCTRPPPPLLHTPGEGSLGPHLACIWLPVRLNEGNCSNNNSRLVRGSLALLGDAWLLTLVCGWVLHHSAPGNFHASCEMCSGSSWMTCLCLWLCIWRKHATSFFFFKQKTNCWHKL